MKKFILSGVLTMFVVGVIFIPNANAQTPSVTVLEQIKVLMEKLVDLQNQLAALKGELKDVIKDGLEEGMTDDDIREIQDLLASDPTIYPEGIRSGYFGPLTKAALKRFQAKYELEVTGEIDLETKSALETLLEARFGEGQIPQGLLHAPGIQKKFEMRLRGDCDDSDHGAMPICTKLKLKYKLEDDDSDDDDSNDDDSDDDSNDDDSDDGFDVEVEIEDDGITVEFTFDGEKYTADLEADADLDGVLAAAALELDVDLENLDEDLKSAIEDEFNDELNDDDDSDDDDSDDDNS